MDIISKLARRLKIYLIILLLTPFFLLAEFDADDKRLLDDIKYYVEETAFWSEMSSKPLLDFLDTPGYETPDFNHPSHTIDEFYDLEVSQSTSLGSLLQYLINFRLDYLTRNRYNSHSLTNILEALTFFSDDFRDYYNDWTHFNAAEDTTLQLMFRGLSQRLDALNRNITNLSYTASSDLGIVTNIYEVTTNINNAVQSLAESQINDDLAYSAEDNLSNSQSTLDLLTEKFYSSTEHLTNLNSSVDLDDYEYDFSQYTNVSLQIDLIKNNYSLNQTLSATNQLTSAIGDTQTEIENVVNDLKSKFTSRTYDSKIVWRALVQNPLTIDLKDYVKFTFDFQKFWDFILLILTIVIIIYFIHLIWT